GRRLAALRDGFEARLREAYPGLDVHGAGAPRVPNTSSFHLPGLPGRHLVIRLDLAGFAISTGSACSTGSARPSHVLEAMGYPAATARDSLRVSLGAPTTSVEIDHLLEALGAATAHPGEGSIGRPVAAVPARTQ
ncbi:MAG TPA: aminotransferase class V-fold PLP-dependent enzyme, partial [Candidatus Saccharimonadales bacterium]|nr:aminotransferase class V-fold PLP-dependent enzyme [Candidatus Saccharimonadales bacterium]